METAEELFNTEMEMMKRTFLTAQVPPNCYQWMNVQVLHYESRTMLSIRIPVTEEMLNPMRVMQGGFVTAAFDNAFGPLSYVAAKNPCTTLDMHTQYIRPIPVGEELTVTVRVVSRGPVSLHLSGEAFNRKENL
jgi:uncharacterized protein (TIGR00369 family)